MGICIKGSVITRSKAKFPMNTNTAYHNDILTVRDVIFCLIGWYSSLLSAHFKIW